MPHISLKSGTHSSRIWSQNCIYRAKLFVGTYTQMIIIDQNRDLDWFESLSYNNHHTNLRCQHVWTLKYLTLVILTTIGYGKTNGTERNPFYIFKGCYSTSLDKTIEKLHFWDKRGYNVDQ